MSNSEELSDFIKITESITERTPYNIGVISRDLQTYRATAQADINKIRNLVCEFHAESRYSYLAFSEEKFNQIFSKAIASPEDTLSLYTQYKSHTVGLLYAGVGDYYLGDGGRMVTIYGWYVSKEFRSTLLGGKISFRLLRLAAEWAQSQQARELHIHSTSGIEPEKTDRLVRRMKFKTYGGNYVAQI